MSLKLFMFLTVGFIILLNFQRPVLTEKQNKLKFCMVESKHTHESILNHCLNLRKSKNSKVECIIENDRITCLKLLINNQVDFMTAEPEDLIVVGLSEANNNQILVTHELRVWKEENSNFKMVFVVRENIKNLFHTEDTHVCLPGFEKDSVTLDYVKRFETKLVASDCNPSKSLLKNRLSILSEYFDSACISGPWTSDNQLDIELKTKYENLCSMCGNHFRCSEEDEYYGREGVLLCLTEGGGDVAWARLDFVRQHFKQLENEEAGYKLLCLDGSSRKLSDDPCTWLEEPWRTIIARTKVAEKVSKFISNLNDQMDDFFMLLQHDLRRTPVAVETLKTPNDYLKTLFPDYYSLRDNLECKPNRRIKWCVTTNLEAEKCKWLSYAAKSYGVEPLIECIQENSIENCIDSVKNGISDIFGVKSNDEFEARKKGLKSIIHMVTTKQNSTKTATVDNFSNSYVLKDLKNRKPCFSGFRDAGWNAFIYLMRNLTGDNDWYCRDKEMVSQFFKESCVVDLDKRNSSFPNNLYSLCSHTEFNNNEKMTENCLNSGMVDVAFFNFNSIVQFLPKNFDISNRTLCVNGSISSYHEKQKCILSWTTLGSIMVNKNISLVREEDISLMLTDLNRLFGDNYQGLTPLISLFGPFDEKNNVIFPEFTQSLERDIRNFRSSQIDDEILEDFIKHNHLCNEANSLKKKFYSLLLVSLIYSSRIMFKLL